MKLRSVFAFAVAVVSASVWGPNASKAQDPARVDRLERMAVYLERNVTPAHFDIGNWGSTPDPTDPSYVGCVAGHATFAFRAEGFRYDPAARLPEYRGKQGIAAGAAFFGVSPREAGFLFSQCGGAGRDPKKAAANLRRVAGWHRATTALASL